MDFIDQLRQTWRYRRMPRTPNLVDVAHQLAANSSAEYQTLHRRQTPDDPYDHRMHRAIYQQADPQGHVLEFGVATARTIRNFARVDPARIIHGFDSFQGLPETWTWLFPRGSFRQAIPRVPPNVQLHVGLIDQTLPRWRERNPGNIALMHIDVDLYSPTRTILELLNQQIQPGTIVIFDEYMNYPGWEQDEFRAWQEFVGANQIQYEYIGRVTAHQQVAIRVLVR